jgi:hypothetical protein
LAALEDIHAKQVAEWAKGDPRLNQKLNLLLRDQSLEAALEAIARQSGLSIQLVPGSLDDAAALSGVKEVRVTCLDLRGATAAQGLDWLLHPARLSWWCAKGSVVAASARRGGREAPWVYDVRITALPQAAELEKEKEYQKRIELAKKAADEFLGGVRKSLSLTEEAVAWLAPGSLVIMGDGNTHAAAAKLLSDLADPGAQVADDLKELHKVTSQRAAARKEAVAKAAVAREMGRAYAALDNFSWRLLAEAAAGKLDLEALTELQVAWKSERLAEILKEGGAMTALRCAWAIGQSAGALPAEQELAALAKAAREQVRSAAQSALADLEKNREDGAAFARTLYAALAMQDDAEFLLRARSALAPVQDDKSPLAVLRRLATALLGPADADARKALAECLDKSAASIRGDDLVTLMAIACRRAGGELWDTFRGAQRDVLGGQPLDGSVVVLVNRLAGANLPILAAKP